MTEKNIVNLKTIPELKNLLRNMNEKEYSLFEKEIILNGCRDSIIFFKYEIDGKLENIIIDGHHRWAVCIKNNIPYKTIEMFFKTLDEAQLFVINNQENRRNFTNTEISYFRGMKYNLEKKREGRPNKLVQNALVNSEIKITDIKTELMEKYKISYDTIKRDYIFYHNFNKTHDCMEKKFAQIFKHKIFSEELNISAANFSKIAKLDSSAIIIKINELMDISDIKSIISAKKSNDILGFKDNKSKKDKNIIFDIDAATRSIMDDGIIPKNLSNDIKKELFKNEEIKKKFKGILNKKLYPGKDKKSDKEVKPIEHDEFINHEEPETETKENIEMNGYKSTRCKLTGPEMDVLLKHDREEKENNEMSINLPGEKVKKVLNFIIVQGWELEAIEYFLNQFENSEKLIDYISEKIFEITKLGEPGPERKREMA